MRDEKLADLAAALRELLQPHLAHSEPLRRVVQSLSLILLEEVRRIDEESAEPRDRAPDVDDAPSEAPAAAPPRTPEAAGSDRLAELPLTFGDAEISVPVRDTPAEIERARASIDDAKDSESAVDETDDVSAPADDEPDLALIERRARLKAASCRHVIARRAAEGDASRDAVMQDEMGRMIAEEKSLPNCFLWVFWREAAQPDDATLDLAAGGYDATAEAAAVLARLERLGAAARDEIVQETFTLAAEASSALRVALQPTWLTLSDADQDGLHRWLRRETSERGVYIPRFMRLDDAADPRAADDLIRRLGAIGDRIDAQADRLKRIKAAFAKMRHHFDQLDPTYGGSFDEHHYAKITESIDRLADLGVPPSDPRYRPIIGEEEAAAYPPDAASPSVERVLDELRAWHASRQAAADADDGKPATTTERWSERVREVRGLLAGGGVVIVGGLPKPDAIERMKDAFDLADVDWVRLSEHGTGQPMQAPIRRATTRLVLVLVKLTGHLHAEEAAAYAKDAGKALVNLTAGYNPEQIADAVLRQASEQLRENAVSSGARTNDGA